VNGKSLLVYAICLMLLCSISWATEPTSPPSSTAESSGQCEECWTLLEEADLMLGQYEETLPLSGDGSQRPADALAVVVRETAEAAAAEAARPLLARIDGYDARVLSLEADTDAALLAKRNAERKLNGWRIGAALGTAFGFLLGCLAITLAVVTPFPAAP
jgi:hypothetical protein